MGHWSHCRFPPCVVVDVHDAYHLTVTYHGGTYQVNVVGFDKDEGREGGAKVLRQHATVLVDEHVSLRGLYHRDGVGILCLDMVVTLKDGIFLLVAEFITCRASKIFLDILWHRS